MSDKPERRNISFQSLEAAIADAEQLAGGEVRTTGKHSFGQILEHLARTHDMSCGKVAGPKPPWYMRLMMPLVRGMIVKGPVKPGFKLPADAEAFFWPEEEVDVQTALQHLKESVSNYQATGPLAVHPVFGKLSADKVDRLNCNHCAMHLSFVHPV